jgi:hypothetical protein
VHTLTIALLIMGTLFVIFYIAIGLLLWARVALMWQARLPGIMRVVAFVVCALACLLWPVTVAWALKDAPMFREAQGGNKIRF